MNHFCQHSSQQRVLISPTDFLTLTEELNTSTIGVKSSAVKKDVNLSTSCLELIKHNDSSNNLSISLERYCESPFLLGGQRDCSQLISDEDDENSSQTHLSETHEEMSTDDLFGTTLADQHSALREVVITPVDTDSARATPVNRELIRYISTSSSNSNIGGSNCSSINSSVINDVDNVVNSQHILTSSSTTSATATVNGNCLVIKEEKIEIEEARLDDLDDNKSNYTLLNPLDNQCEETTISSAINDANHLQSNQSSNGHNSMVNGSKIELDSNSGSGSSLLNGTVLIDDTQVGLTGAGVPATTIPSTTSSVVVTTSSPSLTNSNCVTMALPVTPLDIKILPTGLLQLAANIAAVFPSSTMQKQITLQLLREDGTPILVPITTRSTNDTNNHTQSASITVTTTVSGDTGSSDVTGNTQMLTADTQQLQGQQQANTEAERPFKCELCNSTFTRLGNYTRHKKIHSLPSKEDQRFRCDICGKSFIQRCDLARHLHIHRGTEPHRCSQCGKGYIRHSDLVTHQRFHNKEKPFACPHCSKGFCQRGDLNRHLRSIHLQLKPILCSHCHKKFAKEETLLRHINANHRDKITMN